MNVSSFFYKVVLASKDLQVRSFLGSAFPVTPGGGLITCRHVLEVDKKDDEFLAVADSERRSLVPIQDVKMSEEPDLDIAYVARALRREKPEFFPILSPEKILMGKDIYSVGFFLTGNEPVAGYFKGNIVNFSAFTSSAHSMSLSYPVIEGMSGSPVLTYHNGPKVVGLCHGSVQSRIVASETVEYQDDSLSLRETVSRIVELGQAYHAGAVIAFLRDLGVKDFVVSSERIAISGVG
ncbi:MAG: serine protease [Caldilineaceae bacterium]|nr:serine protease [Caldilineaceae bacterium]